MAWMRAVCGRLKSDYRYSAKIVYNNFPWPDFVRTVRSEGTGRNWKELGAAEIISRLETTARGILDARALFPDASLADLYDDLTMPRELREAHRENDRAVMKAYGFSTKISESQCVAELMKRYAELAKD